MKKIEVNIILLDIWHVNFKLHMNMHTTQIYPLPIVWSLVRNFLFLYFHSRIRLRTFRFCVFYQIILIIIKISYLCVLLNRFLFSFVRVCTNTCTAYYKFICDCSSNDHILKASHLVQLYCIDEIQQNFPHILSITQTFADPWKSFTI